MIRQTFAAAAMLAAIATSACVTEQGPTGLTSAHHDALKAAVGAPTRTAANIQRDRCRHPYETLAFFGVRPSDTVVEIWPAGGWYTEILAPYLRQGGGTYYAAGMGADGLNGMRRMMEANPSLYGDIRLA